MNAVVCSLWAAITMLVLLPLTVYFCVKMGTLGYLRAREYYHQKKGEQS